MKSFVFLALLSLSILPAMAQDVIVHKDGNVIVGKVIEIDKENIRYKKADNPDGPTYSSSLKDVLSVRYENGKTESFGQLPVQNKEQIKEEVEEEIEEIEEEDDSERNLFFHPEVHVRCDASTREEISGGFGAEFVAGFQLTPQWSFGPGAGIIGHEYGTLLDCTEYPIFVNTRYLLNNKPFAPYVSGQLGYTFTDSSYDLEEYTDGFQTDDDSGVFLNLGIGMNMRLKRGNLFLDFNYRLQHINHQNFSSCGFFGACIGYSWGK